MKQLFRIFTLIAVAMLTAGQAWADGTIAIGTTEGGCLTCYSDAACTSNTKIASAAAGTTVYVRAVADGIHTLVGMTASNISVEETSGSGAAEARSVTRAPGIGLAVAVSAVEGKLGLYSFTMPSDGWNVCVKGTFPDKAKTTAALAYQDWNGTALASAEKTAGQVYILDGTESILGTPGTSATNMTDVWYVCQTSATANSGAGLAYGDRYADNAVLTCADYCRVHLILKDGSKMTVESTHRGICDNNEHGAALSIYAQSDGTDMGVLTVSGTAAIETTSSLTINGGKVTATGTNGQGLCVNYGDIAIHGGEVTGIGTGSDASIFAENGDITITGGKISGDQGIACGDDDNHVGGNLTITGGEVTVNDLTDSQKRLAGSISVTITGGKVTADVISGRSITLGWTNADDYIKANTYYGTVKTANSNSETHENSFMVNNVDDTDLNNPIETTIAAIAGNTTLTAGQRDQLNDLAGYKVFTPASDGLTYLDWDHSDPTDATSPMALVTKNITTDGIDANNYISVLSGYHNDNFMDLGAFGKESWFMVIDSNKEPVADGHSIDAAYVGMLNILGNVHLILADGAEMTVTSEDNAGINCYSVGTNTTSLAIHGQDGTTKGALTTTGNIYGIKGHDGVTIYGATVTATGVNYGIGISSETTVDIHGSTVTATGEGYGIDAQNGITISGSKVTAMSDYAGISSNNDDITLGWTNDDDFILTNSYSGTVKTATGQRFVAYVAEWTDWRNPTVTDDAAAIVSGTKGIDFNNNAINGKFLRPLDSYCVATANSHVIFNGKTDTDGKIKPDFSIGGTHYYTYNENEAVTLSGGEDGVKVDVSGLPSGTTYDADNSTFTMPGKDVTLTLSRYMANVDYMDWDATDVQLVKKNTGSDSNTANNKVYILDGYEKTIGQDKEETWYVCNTPASNNSGKGLEYSSATISDFAGILLEGNVHLILANGSKMSVSDEDNVSGSATIDGHAGGSTIQGQSVAIGGFTIHGQGGTTEGILDVISTNSVDKAIGISYNYEDINICGGTINIVAHATGDRSYALGIYVEFSNLNIYGGNIYIRSWDEKAASSRGLYANFDGNSTHVGSGNVNILGGTVNVITSDNAYTENTTTYAIYAENGNVTISNATVTTFGVYANEVNGNTTLVTSSPPRYGIYAVSGELDGCGKVIITGNANIDAVGETGIGAEKLVQINSGTVSATRISSAGDIEINGGQVDSHTTIINMERVDSYETIDPNNTDEELHYPGDALHADGSIILGWTAATDYVRAYRISTGTAVGEDPAVVKTADGKRFVAYHVDDSDTDNPVETPVAYLAGNTTLTDAELANINDPVCYKVFRPVAAAVLTVPDNVSVVDKTADFNITTGEGEQAVTTHYYLYNATAQSPVTVTASYDGTDFIKLGGLSEGTTLNAVANQPKQRSFAMTNGDIVLTATAVTPEKADGDIVYNGSAQTPDFTDGTTAMTLGTDYSTAVTKGGEAVSGAINVGTDYAVTLTGLGQYVGTTAAYDFSIVQKEVAITADDVSVGTGLAYTGSALSPEVTVSYTEGETTTALAATDFTVSYQKQTSTDPVAYENVSEVKGVGTYVAVVTAVNDGNYTFADVTSNPFEVGKPTLTVKANDISVVYGTSSPAYTATYAGFIEGDTKAVLGGTLSFTSDYTSSSNAGKTFTITPSGLISDKYDISYQTGTLTVTNATMTGVSASGWSGEYDGNAHGITVTKPSGATVRYRTRSTGTYNLTKNPTFADVGNYTVYYQITKSNYNTVTGSKKVSISAANVAYSGGTIKLDQNGYDITLNEGTGSAKPLPVSGHIDDLDYSRKLTTPPVSDGGDAGDGEEDHTGDTVIDDKDANLYTVCLPYVPVTTDEEGNDIEEVTYYTLSSVSGTTLNFTEVQNEDVAAFTPYLVAITGESDYTLSCKDVSFEAEERIITKTVQGDAGIFTFCGTLIGLTNEEAVACSKDVVTAGAIAEAVANAVAEAIAADEEAATDPDRAAAIAEAVTAEVTPGITAEVNAAVEAAIAEGTVYETYILQTGATWGKMKSETADQRKIYIPPFRAFIAGPDVEVPAEARKLDSSFSGNDDNGATGINSIRTIDRDGTERWYDLSGRRIASPGKGIYISNGKKTIKK